MKIHTAYRPKPIPTGSCDWEATPDGYEPGWPYGFGATEEEAVEDLCQSLTSEFEEWCIDTYGSCTDDDWPDRWEEWKSSLDIERI